MGGGRPGKVKVKLSSGSVARPIRAPRAKPLPAPRPLDAAALILLKTPFPPHLSEGQRDEPSAETAEGQPLLRSFFSPKPDFILFFSIPSPLPKLDYRLQTRVFFPLLPFLPFFFFSYFPSKMQTRLPWRKLNIIKKSPIKV